MVITYLTLNTISITHSGKTLFAVVAFLVLSFNDFSPVNLSVSSLSCAYKRTFSDNGQVSNIFQQYYQQILLCMKRESSKIERQTDSHATHGI